jgi:hypothetical protein
MHMPQTVGPYTVHGVSLEAGPYSVTYDSAADAIRAAMRCMSARFTDVRIVDGNGRSYVPTEFKRLFRRKKLKNAK